MMTIKEIFEYCTPLISFVISVISLMYSKQAIRAVYDQAHFLHKHFETLEYEAVIVLNDNQQNRSFKEIVKDLGDNGVSAFCLQGKDGLTPFIYAGKKYLGFYLSKEADYINMRDAMSNVIKYVYITNKGIDKHPAIDKKEIPF